MMQEYVLRRHMAETPAFFDMIRARWQREQRAMCVQPKRDADGRYSK